MAEWGASVDSHACEGKETCLAVCPTDVSKMQPTTVRHPLFCLKINLQGGNHADPVDKAACIGFMECISACPEKAISVDYLTT
jgi:NAD-dependent dihydropyrimidine dehydrogenase PreA subunit